MSTQEELQRGLRGELGRLDVAPLRLLARRLAAGHQLGMHHSRQKGAGLEFLGHREYAPGDDLRRLDHRALMRHGRYLVREFQIETERPLHLIVDASTSMQFADQANDASERPSTKLGLACLLAGASALLARRANDPVGLTYSSSRRRTPFLAPRSGSEQIERIFSALEEPNPEEAATSGLASTLPETGSRLPRGTTIFWFSDFLDGVSETTEHLALLSHRDRTVVLVQILTKTELEFPLRGPLSLEDPESLQRTECEAESVRDRYLERLDAHCADLRAEVSAQDAALLRVRTDDDPRVALRNLTALASRRTR